MADLHNAVMLKKSCQLLVNDLNGVYVDATFGRGGHSCELLSMLGEDARLIAFDKDPDAVSYAENKMKDDRFAIKHASYKDMKSILLTDGCVLGGVNGILMDLGVSSPQLDEPERGFSFRYDAALDMRMNYTSGITAADWLYQTEEVEIANALYNYGEEKHSRRIAKEIIKYQKEVGKISTTGILVKIIDEAVGRFYQKEKNPATRTFQALRIAVNSELEDLQHCLDNVLDLLAPGGRLVVISFHSIEHRLVRQFMQKYLPGNEADDDLFLLKQSARPKFKKVAKVLVADQSEVDANIRSRSAQCRVVEKIAC